MKTSSHRLQRRSGGYALLLVLVFLGISVMLLTTIMNWTSETARLTDRQNEYYTTADAAEAATEKVLTHLSVDYLAGGEQAVINNLNAYKNTMPLASDNPYWANYTFSNAANGSPGVYVVRATNWQYSVLDTPFAGLSGFQATYRILANAQLNNSRNANLTAAVQQDVGVDSIPIFQFAIFYNMDLEIEPSPPMVVGGRVHANGNIYTLPSSSLTFSNDVTASGFITNTFKPGDPNGSRGVVNPLVIFDGKDDAFSSTLNLPVGGDNSSSNVNQILQLPPPGETNSSPLAHSRLYNEADMIIVISDTNMTISAGPSLGGTNITVSSNDWSQFLVDTNIIFNARENSYVRTTQLDVSRFKNWAESGGNPITPSLVGKSAVNILYVADKRTSQAAVGLATNASGTVSPIMASVEPGVELINGQQLPRAGLTVASPDPVYIVGDYNTTSDGANFSKSVNNTTFTRPASILGDSINVLSTAWSDANSSLGLSSRVAADTTVNAAFLTGIVPTGNGFYSGGVENLPRFLENWSGKNFYYNGSMVVMFNSQIATAPWNNGTTYYQPPSRHWAFDVNFLDQTKLPPGTPQVLFLNRLAWLFQKPGYVPL